MVLYICTKIAVNSPKKIKKVIYYSNYMKTTNSKISEESISEFVKNLVDDNTIKCFLPKFVENKVYITIITLVLNMLVHLLQDFEICIFDHTIKCTIKPSDECD